MKDDRSGDIRLPVPLYVDAPVGACTRCEAMTGDAGEYSIYCSYDYYELCYYYYYLPVFISPSSIVQKNS